MFLPLVVAAALAAPVPPASDSLPIFLSDASFGRSAPTECVKAAISRLRDQFVYDPSIRLVAKPEEASMVVEVRECGSTWKTKAGGEFGVGVTLGGQRVASDGTNVQGIVGVARRHYGYVILRASSMGQIREFSSLHRTDYFDEAVSIAASQLVEWIDEYQQAGESR